MSGRSCLPVMWWMLLMLLTVGCGKKGPLYLPQTPAAAGDTKPVTQLR